MFKKYIEQAAPWAPLITFLIGLILGGVLCPEAKAGQWCNSTNVNSTNTQGIATALASAQHQFDFGTHRWQGSIGLGSYESNSAISFAIAKRLDRVLVNANFSHEDNHTGAGVGVNWRF